MSVVCAFNCYYTLLVMFMWVGSLSVFHANSYREMYVYTVQVVFYQIEKEGVQSSSKTH